MKHTTKAPTKSAKSPNPNHLIYFDNEGIERSCHVNSKAFIFLIEKLVNVLPSSDFLISEKQLKRLIKACENRLGGGL